MPEWQDLEDQDLRLFLTILNIYILFGESDPPISACDTTSGMIFELLKIIIWAGPSFQRPSHLIDDTLTEQAASTILRQISHTLSERRPGRCIPEDMLADWALDTALFAMTWSSGPYDDRIDYYRIVNSLPGLLSMDDMEMQQLVLGTNLYKVISNSPGEPGKAGSRTAIERRCRQLFTNYFDMCYWTCIESVRALHHMYDRRDKSAQRVVDRLMDQTRGLFTHPFSVSAISRLQQLATGKAQSCGASSAIGNFGPHPTCVV